ncbi:MAG: XRE family transcriptional regulator [Clostridia bacterium]|nr:XRE family transcriptional regulator [Clostridia bacterium]
MEKKPFFPILEAEIAKRGIKKKDIAERLEITQKSLSNKCMGKTKFLLDEAIIIHSMFPDLSIDELFSHSG